MLWRFIKYIIGVSMFPLTIGLETRKQT